MTLRIFIFDSIKYFTLTTFAVVYNLAPFCTVAFGYFLLNEKVTCLDICSVFMGFTAVILIIYGISTSKEKDNLENIEEEITDS